MQSIIPLEYGKFYHIYNQGGSGTNLFRKQENYEYFMQLYDKHISPITETFAWCLLANHFHLLVRIKEFTPDRVQNPVRFKYCHKNYQITSDQIIFGDF